VIFTILTLWEFYDIVVGNEELIHEYVYEKAIWMYHMLLRCDIYL
jgi:hypothetical protein